MVHLIKRLKINFYSCFCKCVQRVQRHCHRRSLRCRGYGAWFHFSLAAPGPLGLRSPSGQQGALYRLSGQADRVPRSLHFPSRCTALPVASGSGSRQLRAPGPTAWRGRGWGRRAPSRPGSPSPRPFDPGPDRWGLPFLVPASKPVRTSPRPLRVTAMGLPLSRMTPRPCGPRLPSEFSSHWGPAPGFSFRGRPLGRVCPPLGIPFPFRKPSEGIEGYVHLPARGNRPSREEGLA